MNWKKKALIMRICGGMPGGAHFYRFLQKRFGKSDHDPELLRISILLEFANWLKDAERTIPGSTFLEVGTGHLPTIPVCLSLMGAERVITIDLHHRLDFAFLKGLLNRLAASQESLEPRFLQFSSREILKRRFEILQRYKDIPRDFLAHAGIEYRAPSDAARTGLPDASIDCHLSCTVLEHIPPDTLFDVMKEAKRLLKETGVSIHLIDHTDHFWHNDKSISWFNFLRYSDQEWQKIAGNEFAYTNRMRSPDYISLFRDVGLSLLRQATPTRPEIIPDDFPLDQRFSRFSKSDLEGVRLKVLLGKGGR